MGPTYSFCLWIVVSVTIFSSSVLAGSPADRTSSYKCKCYIPTQSCWPSANAWNTFNQSINGRLLFVPPPSYSCQAPSYNAAACLETAQVYENRFWRADHPLAMQQPYVETDFLTGLGCPGVNNSREYCERGNLPYYVVNATTVAHVQSALKFASTYNLRLVVKNTGHDFRARSTASGALSIWLHHFRSINFTNNFVPEGCTTCANYSAAILGPGVMGKEVVDASREYGVVVTSGLCPSVGLAGGWILGGGHGILGPYFGMGVDNALQFKVVTADRTLRIANSVQNPNLFWALRGGGGGTYGVVVETVIRTHPAPTKVIGGRITFQATNATQFTLLVREIIRQVPSMQDNGWSSYIRFFSTNTIIFLGLNLNTSLAYVQSTLAPLYSFVNNTAGLSYVPTIGEFPSYHDLYKVITVPWLNFDGNYQTGTWLLPRKNFDTEANITAQVNAVLSAIEGGFGMSYMNVAGGVINTNNGLDTSLNPAWRKAITIPVLTTPLFPHNATIDVIQPAYLQLSAKIQLFRNLAPDSGAYMNEADPLEVNWQYSYWGNNYARLLNLKNYYDPNNLFVCHKCVGSEGRSWDLNCEW